MRPATLAAILRNRARGGLAGDGNWDATVLLAMGWDLETFPGAPDRAGRSWDRWRMRHFILPRGWTGAFQPKNRRWRPLPPVTTSLDAAAKLFIALPEGIPPDPLLCCAEALEQLAREEPDR